MGRARRSMLSFLKPVCPFPREKERAGGAISHNRLMETNMPSMRQISLYGNDGIDKSNSSQNTLAALAEMAHKILLVGGDPRAASTLENVHPLPFSSSADSLASSARVDVTRIGVHGGGVWAVLATDFARAPE